MIAVRAWALPAWMAAVAAAAPALAADPPRVAAWIEPDAQTRQLPLSAIRVQRGKVTTTVEDGALRSCDVVQLINPSAVVRITLADARRIRLDADTPGREASIPCDRPGLLAGAWAAIRAYATQSDDRAVQTAAMASRGRGGQAGLQIPVLQAPHPRLVAGPRKLYLRWTGGQAPFRVRLQRHGERSVLAERSGITGQEVWLPAVELKPGRYRIEVAPASGDALAEENLVVVAASDAPRLPPELGDAGGLPQPARLLFGADYLVALGDGRWEFEALQRVAPWADKSAAARDWLVRHAESSGAAR